MAIHEQANSVGSVRFSNQESPENEKLRAPVGPNAIASQRILRTTVASGIETLATESTECDLGTLRSSAKMRFCGLDQPLAFLLCVPNPRPGGREAAG